MPNDNELSDEISSESTLVVSAKTTKVYHYVYYVLTVIEILLGFRFFLKLFAANPVSAFARFVYGLTYVLMLPFAGLFPRAETADGQVHSVLEPSTLVAMVFYFILAWAVAKYIVISRSRGEKGKKS